MTWVEVLVEGSSDVPLMRELLTRQFSLIEGVHFKIHPHKGRGNFPSKILKNPELQNRSLLYQLPAKLRGFSTWFNKDQLVLVVVDADDSTPQELLNDFNKMLEQLPSYPRVIFGIAIEETESWLIADVAAVKKAFPRADVRGLSKIEPDKICGAWERLAEAIQAKSKDKTSWAAAIAPYVNFDSPVSPSLQKIIGDIEQELHLK